MTNESISQHMAESKRRPRPRDPNELAKLITDIATGALSDTIVTDDGRDLAAVMMGRRAGEARNCTAYPLKHCENDK